MALTHGKSGGVYKTTAGNTATRVIESTNWTLNITAGEAEIRKHASNWVSRLQGILDWTGTMEGLSDPSSNQTLFMNRVLPVTKPTVVIAFYHGTATLPRWQGTALVRGLTQAAPAADIETMTIDFAGVNTLALKA